MYSTTFALTAIFGIALTNLFLGFAAALLIGRGPKQWSELNDVVTVRYFPLRLLSRRRRPGVAPTSVDTTGSVSEAISPAATNAAVPSPAATSPVKTAAAQPETTTARPPEPSPSPLPKLVLRPPASASPVDGLPPERVLQNQLEVWRGEEQLDETPSMSGIMVTPLADDIPPDVFGRLVTAVQAIIAKQVRKDRRVLQIGEGQFGWFSADVTPEDALMPVARIREVLEKTRWVHDQAPVSVVVHAAVVAPTTDDTPGQLIHRLQLSMKYALEAAESPICVDVHEGPKPVEPLEFDLEEVEFDLDAV